jgi:DNA-binding response OmpR family regulator
MSTYNTCDVLIVEDDLAQCEEMAIHLARSGLDVNMAYNGWSACRQAAALKPRVILLDFDLPDINGVRLAEGFRKILPEAAILMMSGRIDGLSEYALERFGITVFLNKPVPHRALRRAVLKLVRPSTSRLPPPVRTGNGGWLSTGLGGTR